MEADPVLTLAQLLSPSYPIGAFAYSHGLEWAVHASDVHDTETLSAWLDAILLHGAGWCDALFLATAFTARDPSGVDASARAFAPSRERLRETLAQGEAFATTTNAVWGLELPLLTYPVAVGHAAAQLALPLDLTLKMYLQAVLSNLVAAAQRLMPLGQTEGQMLIRTKAPICDDIASSALKGSFDELCSSAFLPDIASMKHETQYSRIFRT